MHGDPAAAAPYWRYQQQDYDCGEMAVADVIGQITNREPPRTRSPPRPQAPRASAIQDRSTAPPAKPATATYRCYWRTTASGPCGPHGYRRAGAAPGPRAQGDPRAQIGRAHV